MNRPRFLADHDLNEQIVVGVLRQEPLIEFFRLRSVGMNEWPDAKVLAFAASNSLLVVSHDVNTMPAAAYDRLTTGQTFPGLLMVQQSQPVRTVIENILLIWSASEMDEWTNLVVYLPLE